MDTVDQVTSCLDIHKINGLLFLTLSPDELQELIPVIEDRKMVKDLIDGIKESSTIKTVRIKFLIIFALFRLQDLVQWVAKSKEMIPTVCESL